MRSTCESKEEAIESYVEETSCCSAGLVGIDVWGGRVRVM